MVVLGGLVIHKVHPSTFIHKLLLQFLSFQRGKLYSQPPIGIKILKFF